MRKRHISFDTSSDDSSTAEPENAANVTPDEDFLVAGLQAMESDIRGVQFFGPIERGFVHDPGQGSNQRNDAQEAAVGPVQGPSNGAQQQQQGGRPSPGFRPRYRRFEDPYPRPVNIYRTPVDPLRPGKQSRGNYRDYFNYGRPDSTLVMPASSPRPAPGASSSISINQSQLPNYFYYPKIIFRQTGPFGLTCNNRSIYTKVRPLPPVELRFPPTPAPGRIWPPKTMYPAENDPAWNRYSAESGPPPPGEEAQGEVEDNSWLFHPKDYDSPTRLSLPNLPSILLYEILRTHSLQTVFTYRHISAYFKTFIEGEFTPRLRSLKLFTHASDRIYYLRQLTEENLDGPEYAYLRLKEIPVLSDFSAHDKREDGRVSRNDDLVLNASTREAFETLGRLFMNLEELVVYFGKESMLQELPAFLDKLPLLRKLTLFGVVSEPQKYDRPRFSLEFWTALSGMPHLAHLDLSVRNLFVKWSDLPESYTASHRPSRIPTRPFTTLSYFALRGGLDRFPEILAALGPKCKKLKLHNTRLDGEELASALARNANLRENIEEVVITGIHAQPLKYICSEFKKLSKLELRTSFTLFYSFMDSLRLASNLTELTLFGIVGLCEAEQSLPERRPNPIPGEVPPAVTPLFLPSTQALSSIKKLTISSIHSFRNQSFDTICQRISVYFPGVESLRLGLRSATGIWDGPLAHLKALKEAEVYFLANVQKELLTKVLLEECLEEKLGVPYRYRKVQDKWSSEWILVQQGFCPQKETLRQEVKYY